MQVSHRLMHMYAPSAPPAGCRPLSWLRYQLGGPASTRSSSGASRLPFPSISVLRTQFSVLHSISQVKVHGTSRSEYIESLVDMPMVENPIGMQWIESLVGIRHPIRTVARKLLAIALMSKSGVRTTVRRFLAVALTSLCRCHRPPDGPLIWPGLILSG